MIRRLLILAHRYIGIPMSVVFVVWFLSGIVMIYTGGMPELDSAERLRGLGPVDVAALELSPAAAAEAAGIDGGVSGLSLQNLLGRPAWRITSGFGAARTVFADTGESFRGASIGDGQREVARFVGAPVDSVHFAGTLEQADQWTIVVAGDLPLERYDVADGRGTRAYFSRRSGEVELLTDRTSRTLAFAGAIPHWFYFTPLRTNQPLWYWTVVWVSAIGCVMAVLGLVLAVTQFRRSRPFRLSASIRYRGSMRWHYYTGALFGVFALTWVFSGLLSMEPFDWTNATGMRLPGNQLQGGALELERYRVDAPAFTGLIAEAAAEVELIRIQGEPFLLATSASPVGGIAQRIIDADTLEPRTAPFAAESILAELEATVTEANIVRHTILEDYDAYYYAQDGAAPLPVLRVEFDDPARSWYYFDLNTKAAVAANHRLSRLERWLFQGLHSLDFPFWYDRRPFWDIGMILLSLGALATSGIGMYLGFRRLLRRPVAGGGTQKG